MNQKLVPGRVYKNPTSVWNDYKSYSIAVSPTLMLTGADGLTAFFATPQEAEQAYKHFRAQRAA